MILHRATKGYRKLKFDSIGIAEGKFLELCQESSQKLPPKWTQGAIVGEPEKNLIEMIRQ